jgi:hypothetical protein
MPRAAKSETDFDIGEPRELRSGQPAANDTVPPTLMAGRYRVQALLGRGGMASVYRAVDGVSGRELAIKQCLFRSDTREGRELCALFEREFHLLAQLTHPRVIEVYDYGIEGGCPYYTMELLDGGDLRELSPLPWQRVCALMYDVCSSIALLHSRRFVHRDISPRNVRCTRAGSAKLIDFGAAVPMGVAPHIVGTPAFLAPEVLARGALDARVDLFAIGATCYFALTGEAPYDAQHLPELSAAWSRAPRRLSLMAPDVPAALDALVMSLISLDPAQRPRSAFEVMQQLAAVAELPHSESLDVSQAYLSAPATVGRDRELDALRRKLAAIAADGGGSSTLVVADSGGGRTHLLDAAALIGKTAGACVLRGGADASGRPFAAAQALLTQLCEHVPADVLAQAAPAGDALLRAGPAPGAAAIPVVLDDKRKPELVRDALAQLLWNVARRTPLLVIVDDVQQLDETDLALLAELAQSSKEQRVCLLLASEQDALRGRTALEVLARYCERLPLSPLDRAATGQLVESLFGDVPNVALISHELYQRAHGNPGATLWLAQRLVDRGVIRYQAGAWTLPAQLSAADLPPSREQAVIEHLARLTPLARELAECQALAVYGVFSHDDYVRLAGEQPPGAVERALLELVSAGVVESDEHAYTLAKPEHAPLLLTHERPGERARQHAALARMYIASGAPPAYMVPHLMAAGEEAQALARLAEHFAREDKQGGDLATDYRLLLPAPVLATIYADGLACAERRAVSRRELSELRRHLVLVSVVEDESSYWAAAPSWRAQLEHDSGLVHYRALDPSVPALERLSQAYLAAQSEHQRTPETERGYAPDEAIRLLVQYVVISIAIAVRSLDRELAASLPALLEPFAPISPVLAAIWQNALATCEYQALREFSARARWVPVYEDLGRITGDELRYVAAIRNAIAFGVATMDASMGRLDVEVWVKALDADPMQRVNAMYLRKMIAMQQGNWEAADRFRKRAELLAVDDRTRQMLTTTLPIELMTHALAYDLSGLKYVCERVDELADRYVRWRPVAELAKARFQLLCRNLQPARVGIEACLELCDPRRVTGAPVLLAFCPAAATYVETLDELGSGDDAVAWGRDALALMQRLSIEAGSWDVERALALAESKHAALREAAAQRLSRLLAAQREAGASGLRLGLTYEALARLALQRRERSEAVNNAKLAAAEYRHGLGSLLSRRYERLKDEARSLGIELPG